VKTISVIILISMLSLMANFASAASGAGAINMTFNTSARASGMGDAGVAMVWGEDTNHWANPALLAFRPGIHYRSFESRLLPGLHDKIVITNEEVTFGAYGVTFLVAKGPVDGNYLDMGSQPDIDENGELLGHFDSYMKSESWGLAVNAIEVLDNMLNNQLGNWTRYVDLAAGASWYDFEDVLAPDYAMQGSEGSEHGEGSAMNMGYVLSVTPVDLTSGSGFQDDGYLGLKLSGSYGASVLNKTEETIVHMDADQSDPFPRAYVSGWSVNFQLTWADETRLKLNEAGFGILGDMINPLFSFTKNKQVNDPGYVWNSESDVYSYEHDTSGVRAEEGDGWEIGVMNVFFIREGNILARYADVDGETEGGGWKIQAGPYGGFRKDWAEVPQASGLDNVRREEWSVWVDPLAIYDGFFKN